MTVFELKKEIWLPSPREEVFSFFSQAKNLERITPTWLQFRILTPLPIEMQAGALIDYRIRLRGLPMRWRTEITAWEPPRRFVDAQVRGPYRQWIHEHTFEEKDGGTLARDHVRYSVWGGSLIRKLFVESDVERIFKYRQERMKKLFPARDAA